MKHLSLFIFLLFVVSNLSAQVEVLKPVQSNPVIYYQTLREYESTSAGSRDFNIDKNIIYTTDTLGLPFIDDFSTITTREYDYQMALATDSAFASGPCITGNDIPFQVKTLFYNQPFQVRYDTALDKNDTFLFSPPTSTFRYYSGTNCFSSFSTITYWTSFYRYTSFESRDTSAGYGMPIDSILVTGDTTFKIAKIYFKNLNPSTKWVDNYAWINTCFPINPLSIGVATLDGLNQYGRPYDNSSPTRYGKADYLTSKPINLGGLSNIDSVYLSFYYQPMGMGDYPNKLDSIIVDIRDKFGGWYPIWSDTGFSSPANTPNTKFLLANIHIFRGASVDDPDPFYNGFQFRIRNKASIAGNNDHWNIDYVQLDRNRTLSDTQINDITIVNRFPSVLKNFSMMPYKQFRGNADLDTFVNMTVRNLNTAITPTVDFAFNAKEINTSSSVYSSGTLSFTAGSTYTDRNLDPRATYTVVSPLLTNVDYTYENSFEIQPTSNNLLTTNDTVKSKQVFDNLLAYDCDCPVKAYGLEGLGLKKFAYEYNLNAPDTLAGVRILFTNINTNVDNLIFSIYAWDSIAIYGGVTGEDSVLTKINIAKPNYVDSITGWTTYKFPSPVLVYNKFYIGWTQTDVRNIQIGYDLTSPKGRDHMYIHTDGEWKKSTVLQNGSPMIRAILDGNYQGASTNIQNEFNAVLPSITAYPNPTTGDLTISCGDAIFDFHLLNTMGQSVKDGTVSHEENISLSELNAGVYSLLLSSKEYTKTIKIVKQ
jgi:hypothetical protein